MTHNEVLTLLLKVVQAADDYEWGAAQMLLNHLDEFDDAERLLVEEAVAIVTAVED
jgi:hypothetical protein